MTQPEQPTCWLCGSRNVQAKFTGYSTAECKKGCQLRHSHQETLPSGTLHCRACGNMWQELDISMYPPNVVEGLAS